MAFVVSRDTSHGTTETRLTAVFMYFEYSCVTTSVQLKITNPRGGGRIHAKTANYGLVVVYMDRA